MQRTARDLASLPAFNRRASVLLLVAAVSFILILFTLFALSFNSQRQRQARLESELRRNETFLATASPASGRVAQLEVQLGNAQQRLAQAQGVLPGTDAQATIVQRILAAAEQSNVELTRLQSLGQEERDGVLAMKYDVAAEGTIQALSDFAYRLEHEIFPIARLTESGITTRDGHNRLTGNLLVYGSTLPGRVAALPTPSLAERQAEIQSQFERALATQDYELALSALTRLEALNPSDPNLAEQRYQTHVAYGEYLLALGHLDLAQQQYEIALNLKPGGTEAAEGLVKLAATRSLTPSPQGTVIVVLPGTPGIGATPGAGVPTSIVPVPTIPGGSTAPTTSPTAFPTLTAPPTLTSLASPTLFPSPTFAPPPTLPPPPTFPLPTSTFPPTFTPFPTPTRSPTASSTVTPGGTTTPGATTTGTVSPSPTSTGSPGSSSGFAFNPSVVTYEAHCSLTLIRGYIRASDGTPLNGVRVVVWWDGMPRSEAPVSFASGPPGYPEKPNGYWDMVLDNKPVANKWYAEVVEMPSRRALSPTVTVETTSDCGSGGRQIGLVDFLRSGTAPVGTPAPTSTSTTIPSATPIPSSTPTPTNTPTVTPTPTPSAIAASKNEDPDLPIPDNSEEKAISVVTIAETGTVRFATVFVNIQHDNVGDLEINLVSPTGKRVQIHRRGQDSGTRNLIKEYTSAQNDVPELEKGLRDEPIHGTWTLEVIDKIQGNNEGALRQWELTLYP
jgi:subtilisin-like proprotein convertase family protein/tetratricopeptide (TPR) repeat protein